MNFVLNRRVWSSLVPSVIGVTLLLAACGNQNSDVDSSSKEASNTAPTYAVFDRAAEEADELPSDIPDYAVESVDKTTARFVGEYEATSLWLMRGREPAMICLVAHQSDQKWNAACGGEQGPLAVSGDAGHFTVVPDGDTGPAGATQISENVFSY